MTTDMRRFRNRLCILRSIDQHEVPDLTDRHLGVGSETILTSAICDWMKPVNISCLRRYRKANRNMEIGSVAEKMNYIRRPLR